MLDRVLTPEGLALWNAGATVASSPVFNNRVVRLSRYSDQQIAEWNSLSEKAVHKDLLTQKLFVRDDLVGVLPKSDNAKAQGIFSSTSSVITSSFSLAGTNAHRSAMDGALNTHLPELSALFRSVTDAAGNLKSGMTHAQTQEAVASACFCMAAAPFGLFFNAGTLLSEVKAFIRSRAVRVSNINGAAHQSSLAPSFFEETNEASGAVQYQFRTDSIYFLLPATSAPTRETYADPFTGLSFTFTRYNGGNFDNGSFGWSSYGLNYRWYRVYVGDLIQKVDRFFPYILDASGSGTKVLRSTTSNPYVLNASAPVDEVPLTRGDQSQWIGSLMARGSGNILRSCFTRTWGVGEARYGSSFYSCNPLFVGGNVHLTLDGNRCRQLFSSLKESADSTHLTVDQSAAFSDIDGQCLWLAPSVLQPPLNWAQHSEIFAEYNWSGDLWNAIKDRVIFDTAPSLGDAPPTETFAQSAARIAALSPTGVFWTPRSLKSLRVSGATAGVFLHAVDSPPGSPSAYVVCFTVNGRDASVREWLSSLATGSSSTLVHLLDSLSVANPLPSSAILGLRKGATLGDYNSGVVQQGAYYFPSGQSYASNPIPSAASQWLVLKNELILELSSSQSRRSGAPGSVQVSSFPSMGDLWFESASSEESGDQNRRLRQLLGLELLALTTGNVGV